MKNSIKKYYLKYIFILFLAIWGSLYIPPMQSPDENQHIARAYLLSQGDIFLDSAPGKMSGGYIDNGLYKFIQDGMFISGSPEKKYTPEMQKELEKIRWDPDNKKTFLEIPGTGFYLPFIYIPHAIAMKFGEITNFSIMNTYRIIKFFLISISLLLITHAFLIYKPSAAILGLILLPMSIFQFLSPTLDGLTTSLCLVIISIFLKIQIENRNSLLFYILTLLIILIATTRIHLIPIFLLLFIISFQTKNKKYFVLSIITVFAIFSWVIFSIATTVDTRIPRSMSSTETIYYYFLHPLDFVKIFYNTISSINMLNFYGESFIGNLGWLDTPLQKIHYVIFYFSIFILFLLSTFSPSHVMNNRTARISFFFIAIASIIAIFTALLVSWTPLPAEVIHGIQGRYFIIPFVLLAYCLHGIIPVNLKLNSMSNFFIFYVFFSFSAYALFFALKNRFYTA